MNAWISPQGELTIVEPATHARYAHELIYGKIDTKKYFRENGKLPDLYTYQNAEGDLIEKGWMKVHQWPGGRVHVLPDNVNTRFTKAQKVTLIDYFCSSLELIPDEIMEQLR